MLLDPGSGIDASHVQLRGVDRAKFRKHVVPGDRLKLEARLGTRPRPGSSGAGLVRVEVVAEVDGQIVAEAELLLAIARRTSVIDPRACVRDGAVIGDGTHVDAFAVIGPNVRIGRDCKIGASAVVDGHTTIGDGTEVYPFASIGLPPQDLKYRAKATRLDIGARNIFREFVTIHRGTGRRRRVTTIGDRNLF